MDILLTSYCDWTEYTLYLLAAERAGVLGSHHLWADHPKAPAHLHTHPAFSIWDSAAASPAQLERLFASEDPGLFAVVQSNSGLPPSEVAAVAEAHFPVRSIPAEEPITQERRSKLQERFRAATRIVAQGVYRLRRALVGFRRRSPRWEKARRVPGGADQIASGVEKR